VKTTVILHTQNLAVSYNNFIFASILCSTRKLNNKS
jgi:hypothetical protein